MIWDIAAVILLGVALFIGPLAMTARGYLRGVLSPTGVRRWYRPVSLGLALGMLGATTFMVITAPGLAQFAALFCLLLLLASIDWQWRWLPVEWTFAVIALGLMSAAQSSSPLAIMGQMLAPALLLLGVRQGVILFTGREALGLGDIWLIAGLGAFLLPFTIFLVIGFASLSGLAEVAIKHMVSGKPTRTEGVSYGTHLCIIFVIALNFEGVF